MTATTCPHCQQPFTPDDPEDTLCAACFWGRFAEDMAQVAQDAGEEAWKWAE